MFLNNPVFTGFKGLSVMIKIDCNNFKTNFSVESIVGRVEGRLTSVTEEIGIATIYTFNTLAALS